MKKILSIGLGFLLVVSTIGITVNKHYSGGKLFSYSLYVDADPCCEMDCNCCYEESATFQVTDKFISPSYDFSKHLLANALAFTIDKLSEDVFSMQKSNVCLRQDKSPPKNHINQEYNQAFLL